MSVPDFGFAFTPNLMLRWKRQKSWVGLDFRRRTSLQQKSCCWMCLWLLQPDRRRHFRCSVRFGLNAAIYMFAGLAFTAQFQWSKAIQLSPMCWFVSVTVLRSPKAKSMIYIILVHLESVSPRFIYIFSLIIYLGLDKQQAESAW